MRICSDQPCIVLLTEKDVWIRVNGKEPISLKANHMALLNCENNIIDVSSLNNTLVAHISHDIIKDYLRFLLLLRNCTYCIFLFEELPSFIIPFYFASERTLVNYLNSSVK